MNSNISLWLLYMFSSFFWNIRSLNLAPAESERGQLGKIQVSSYSTNKVKLSTCVLQKLSLNIGKEEARETEDRDLTGLHPYITSASCYHTKLCPRSTPVLSFQHFGHLLKIYRHTLQPSHSYSLIKTGLSFVIWASSHAGLCFVYSTRSAVRRTRSCFAVRAQKMLSPAHHSDKLRPSTRGQRHSHQQWGRLLNHMWS